MMHSYDQYSQATVSTRPEDRSNLLYGTGTVITLVTGFLLRSLKYAAEDTEGKKNIFLILALKIFYVMWHITYTYACLNFPT